MQYFAQSEDGKAIVATEAAHGQTFFCPECRGQVRAKGGGVRKRHFFHLQKNQCRQGGKSLAHLQTQLYIQKKLLGSQLEVPLSSRIADLYWPEGQLVYEVQCSPILGSEVLARNSDYGAMGIRVIWVFHDRRFNRRKVTAAESVLKGQPFLYTNIDDEGRGTIYSQARQVQSGRVERWGSRQTIDLTRPEPAEDLVVDLPHQGGWYRALLRHFTEGA